MQDEHIRTNAGMRESRTYDPPVGLPRSAPACVRRYDYDDILAELRAAQTTAVADPSLRCVATRSQSTVQTRRP